VPTAGINLISIGVVTAIPGMKVEFEDRYVVFKLNGTVEMNCQQGSGKTLYRLNIKAITEVKQDIFYAANSYHVVGFSHYLASSLRTCKL
jgi:hypothetical protein